MSFKRSQRVFNIFPMRGLTSLFTLIILLSTSCKTFPGLDFGRYHKTSKTCMENVDLNEQNELVKGEYIVFRYSREYNIPGWSDEEHSDNVYIKLRSFNDLPVNKKIKLPDSSIIISANYRSAWDYYEKKITKGSIERLPDQDGEKIRIRLYYKNKKGKTKKVLCGKHVFKRKIVVFFE